MGVNGGQWGSKMGVRIFYAIELLQGVKECCMPTWGVLR